MARGTIRTPDEKLISKLKVLSAPFGRKIARIIEQLNEQYALRDALLNVALEGSDPEKRKAYIAAAGIDTQHSIDEGEVDYRKEPEDSVTDEDIEL